MDELSGTTLATGWWCQECEFFERDDDINTEVELCVMCGCPGFHHKPVEVVCK